MSRSDETTLEKITTERELENTSWLRMNLAKTEIIVF
jgi:hypothetical protein